MNEDEFYDWGYGEIYNMDPDVEQGLETCRLVYVGNKLQALGIDTICCQYHSVQYDNENDRAVTAIITNAATTEINSESEVVYEISDFNTGEMLYPEVLMAAEIINMAEYNAELGGT